MNTRELKAELFGRIRTSFHNEGEGNESIKRTIDFIHTLRQQLEGELSDEELQQFTNLAKSRVQFEANQAIDMAGGFALIAMATGTGKSKIAVDRVVSMFNNYYGDMNNMFNRPPKILLVVPTEKLRDVGWREEFLKWQQASVWAFVKPICYASLDSIENETWDLVILDECHNITENNAVFFKNNIVESCVALTATPPNNVVKNTLLANILHKQVVRNYDKWSLPPTYEITLDEAVKLGLVAPYDITIVTMPLDDVDKYIKSGSKEKPFYQTEKQKHDYLCKSVMFGANKLARINRMQFVYNLKSKTLAAQRILEHKIPKDLRTIIFAGSKDQANQVCEYRYYSKPTKPKRLSEEDRKNFQKVVKYNTAVVNYSLALKEYQSDVSLNKFLNEEIDRLACCEALNEGHNIPNVDIAFIIQLNSNSLDLIQRLGRIIRFRPGHLGKVIILVAEGTVDAEWATKAMYKLDRNRIRWITLEDLRTNKETLIF